MSVGNVWVLHGIVNGATFLSQISNDRVVSGIQNVLAYAAGFPQPLFTGVMQQNPGCLFDTKQIKTVLDLAGISMGNLSGANTDMYFKKAVNLGSREADASTVHLRLRAAASGISWTRISAGTARDADISAVISIPFDGTNAPVVPAGSVALAGTPGADQNFVAGPIWLNGVQYNAVQEVTIESGVQLLAAFGDGELYPTFIGVQIAQPTITFRTLENPWVALGLNGIALTSLSCYLRKRATLGRVADGTAQHIKFSATAGHAAIDETASGDNQEAGTMIRCTLVAPNAAGNAMTVNTAIAITT
jgi:hypothetical protein